MKDGHSEGDATASHAYQGLRQPGRSVDNPTGGLDALLPFDGSRTPKKDHILDSPRSDQTLDGRMQCQPQVPTSPPPSSRSPGHSKFLNAAKSPPVPELAAARAPHWRDGSSNDPQAASSSARDSSQSVAPRPPWNDDEVRQSDRSALTATSSGFDPSATERSSILTSNTSESETQNFQPEWPQIEEEEISVDEVFSLYAGGFSDDLDDESYPHAPRSPSSPPALSRNSYGDVRPQTAGPLDNTERPQLLTVRSDTIIRRNSTPRISTSQSDSRSRELPISGSSVLRDRYGFKCANQYISLEQYNDWNAEYTGYLKRRLSKWQDLMMRSNLPVDKPVKFPPRSEKVKKYIRKGIPPEWRGAAWFWYSDGPLRLAERPGLYERLVRRVGNGEISDVDKEHIERDLNRTFPDNIYFKPDQQSGATVADGTAPPETSMIRSLRRVLQAFAIYRSKIGYCQSLNFLAGLLLLFLKDEEKAFFMLDIVTSDYLPGTHGVALEGANVDIGVLMNSIKDTMPSLWSKIDDRRKNRPKVLSNDMRDGTALPTLSLATTSWFMSCFVSTLPIETTLRVWDCLFYEGSKTLFRIALTIFKTNERQFLAYNDPMEIFQLVQTLPRKMIDANELMYACYRRKIGVGLLSQDKVDSRRAERRDLYAQERTAMAATDPWAPQPTKLRRATTRGKIKNALSTKKTL